MTTELEVDQLCVWCRKDTSFGSGWFVNRLPMETEDRDGYACAECQQMKCDECKDLTLEYTLEDGRVRCYDCADRSAE
jgi:hypothetical protein